MKIPPASLVMLATILPLIGQETAPKWNVRLPSPLSQEAPVVSVQKPESIKFKILNSQTKEVRVQEPAEMPDLPPIEGTIKMTIQSVANPGLTDPPPPLPILPPDDPAVLARLRELRKTYRGTELVFLSATVYLENDKAENARTLLRIFPNGQLDQEVVAWSNINFLHLTGQGGYHVTQADGTSRDIGILMGVSPIYDQSMRKMAERGHRDYEGLKIPELPDLATAGPTFSLEKGDENSPAMDVLEQLHDLFKGSGQLLKDEYFAREKARIQRKAFLLANPPKPNDVTIRVWSRTPDLENAERKETP